jgi:hypothetical protein
MCHVAAFALSLLNCTNASVRRYPPSEKLSKRYSRRPGHKFADFKIVSSERTTHLLETEGGARSSGLKRGLHLCRGHFKDYRHGNGLYGKNRGIYWWDDYLRGRGMADVCNHAAIGQAHRNHGRASVV